MMSKIIQISDTHIVAEGALAYGRSDTAAALHAAVATINAALPRIGPVDCAIVTGDLVDFALPKEYARFRSIMDALDLPYLAIPGNHDRRDSMRKAFANCDWMPRSGPVQWRRDLPDFTILGLDTLVAGKHHGEISDAGFAFLDAALTGLGDHPVLVATHHPIFHSGITPMDLNNLRNGMALLQRLSRHTGQVRLVSGHLHRTMTAQFGKVTCQIGPATCHAVHLDQRDGAINALRMEPGGVTLLEWRSKPFPGFVSDVLPVGDFQGPWPFYATQEAYQP